MTSPLQRLHSVPVLGYLSRLVTGVARLPVLYETHQKGIEQLQAEHGAAMQRVAALEEELRTARAQFEAGASERRSAEAREQQARADGDQRHADLRARHDELQNAIAALVARHDGLASRHETSHATVASQHATLGAQYANLLKRHEELHGAVAAQHAALVERHEALHGAVAAEHAMLFKRQEELTAALAALEEGFKGLQAALDRGLPSFMNVVTSHAATTRLLRREQDAVLVALQAMAAEGAKGRTETVALGELHAMVRARERRAEEALREAEACMEAVEAAARAAKPAPASLESLRGEVDALRQSVNHLLHRVEFVRRETLFEVRYGKAGVAAESAEPRIVATEKVARAMREGLRLNVGCGHVPIEGYVNVDARELPGVDVVATATRLPFEPGSVVEIFSSHLMEHFPEEQLRREVLPYWRSLLAPGGRLRGVVPDAATMIAKYGEGAMPFEDLREVTFGAQDYAGDFHYTMFTPESLAMLLAEAGFRDVRFPVKGRANGKCYEMELAASA